MQLAHQKKGVKVVLERIVDEELSDTYMIFQDATKMSMELYNRVKEFQETKQDIALANEIVQYRNEYPFMFRGNVFDMSYFWNHSELPLPEIRKLHTELQHQVMKTFNNLAKEKYVKFLPDKDCYVLTPKGKNQLYKSRFVLHTLQGDVEINQKIEGGIRNELSSRVRERKEQIEQFLRVSRKYDCYLDGDNGAYIKAKRDEEQKLHFFFSDGKSEEIEIKETMITDICEKSIVHPKTVKTHRPEIEINFNDSVLRTNNEILREAGSKALTKSVTAKSATLVTGKIGIAIEIGRKILEMLSFLSKTQSKTR